MRPVGVAGAGTMGAGIAALAAEARLPTLLYDPDPEALARAPENVEPVRDLSALTDCGLVIKAPEDLDLKRNLFARLADVVEPDCVQLGLNHPRGPLARGELWGLDAVLAVLEGLLVEYRDARWRPAPTLVRAFRAGYLER